MTILDDIRAQHPGAYDDMSDGQLASAFRKKYYADMPAPDFYRKAGLADLVGLDDKPVTGVSDSGVENFRAGMGKAFSDTVGGLKQLGNRVQSLQSFGLDPALQAEYAQEKADQAEANARDKPLLGTKAGLAGNVAGYASQILAPAGALGIAGRGAAIGGALLPTTLAGAAKQGAVMGLAQPLEGDQGEGSRLLNTGLGAGTGLLGAAVPRAIGAGLRGAKGLIAPFFDSGQNGIVADALSRFGGDAALNAKPSAIPGVKATMAEQTGDAGLAQLQRSVADSDPAIARQFAEQRSQNNAARMGLLQDIAGTPEDVAAAKAARSAQANELYGAAGSFDADRAALQQATADANVSRYLGGKGMYSGAKAADSVKAATLAPSDTLQALAKRPAMQSAIQDAKTLAANSGVEIGDDPLTSVQGLHYIKLALDDALNVGAQQGIGNVQKAAITGTRESLIDEIGKVSPDYIKAKDAFKAASGPINQQEILQGLLGKATTNTEDALGNQVAQPTKFANAAAQLDSIAQKVTGQKGAKAASILTPEQQDTIGLLGSDLSRQAVADSVGKSAGSNTVQNLASQSLLGNVTRGAGLPGLADSGLLGRVVKPVDAAYKLFGIPDQLKEKLAQVMLNPNSPESQAILKKIPKSLQPTIESQLGPIFGAVGQSARLGVSQEPPLKR